MPRYYIEVETRTYTDDEDTELLIGISDAVVLSTTNVSAESPNQQLESSTIATRPRPERVQLPIGLEVRERYLEVREMGTDAVIAVIELLSPQNKRAGKGRVVYEEKRQRVLDSASHFIKLDLLRGDLVMPMVGHFSSWHYRILVSRSDVRPDADLYGFTLQESIPMVPLPLKSGDTEPWVDLQAIFTGVYDRAGYQYRLDYHQAPPPPPLTPSDQHWTNELLAHRRES